MSYDETDGMARVSRPTFSACRSTSRSARRALISRRMRVGALAAVALLDGDVLNAAAALKDFAPLKGRGARFERRRHRRDRRKLQRQSRFHGGGAGAARRCARAAASRCWATCWKWAGAAPPITPALAAPDRSRACRSRLPVRRPDEGAVGCAAGVAPRRLCRDFARACGAAHAPRCSAGDTVLVKGSNGSKMSVIIDALKARAA